MKLTKSQMSELLDFINQVNEDNIQGPDSMRGSSFASTLGVALLRSLRSGSDFKNGSGNAQAADLQEEWQASTPRYDFSGK